MVLVSCSFTGRIDRLLSEIQTYALVLRLQYPEHCLIQQGSIFNCVQVPQYERHKCYGIVMTARCDLEWDKQSVINFLPIVPFSAWAVTDMSRFLARRMRPTLEKQVFKRLTDNSATKQMIETFPIEDIILQLLPKKERQKALDQYALLKLAEKVSTQPTGESEIGKDLIRRATRDVAEICEELITQRLSEYYFLEHVDVSDHVCTEGYVVLLRRMNTIDNATMHLVATGFCESQELPESIRNVFTLAIDPVCMITGVLRSPDVEHLCQRFAQLFTRIGLDDHTTGTISHHKHLATLI